MRNLIIFARASRGASLFQNGAKRGQKFGLTHKSETADIDAIEKGIDHNIIAIFIKAVVVSSRYL